MRCLRRSRGDGWHVIERWMRGDRGSGDRGSGSGDGAEVHAKNQVHTK